MVSNARKRMIEGAMALLAKRGLQATSFSEVLAATGAPRGSLYHHFPDGKDQLVAAAIDLAGDVLTDFMNRCTGSSIESVVQHFLVIWRTVLIRSECGSGCAVLAVTVATDSNDLLAHATAVFGTWRKCLADLLKVRGLPDEISRRFAMVLIASAEGAIVISRAERSLEPFEAVAQQLVEEAHRLQVHTDEMIATGSNHPTKC